MSLINEALKKAQRQRAAEAAAGQAGTAGEPSERVEKRAKAMRAQTVILLAAAATVLIVFSVVITVYWVNSTPEPTPVAARSPAATKSAPPPAAVTSGPKPITVALPVTAHPSNTSAPPPTDGIASADPKSAAAPANIAASAQAATSPAASAPATSAPAASAPAAAAATPPPIEIPRVSTAPQPNPRVQAFVDTVRVAGIRSSGADSKVIMNDRVYRVNDVVERTLGVKLVKVEPDTLTFADPNGLTYTKTF